MVKVTSFGRAAAMSKDHSQWPPKLRALMMAVVTTLGAPCRHKSCTNSSVSGFLKNALKWFQVYEFPSTKTSKARKFNCLPLKNECMFFYFGLSGMSPQKNKYPSVGIAKCSCSHNIYDLLIHWLHPPAFDWKRYVSICVHMCPCMCTYVDVYTQCAYMGNLPTN